MAIPIDLLEDVIYTLEGLGCLTMTLLPVMIIWLVLVMLDRSCEGPEP